MDTRGKVRKAILGAGVLCLFLVLFWFSSLTLARYRSSVVVTWSTASEFEIVGFNLLRGRERQGPFVRVNPHLIPASSDPWSGAEYSYTDSVSGPADHSFYLLQSVNYRGETKDLEVIEIRRGYWRTEALPALALAAAVMIVVLLAWSILRRRGSDAASAHRADGDGSRIYTAICRILTGRGRDVEWNGFVEDDWRLLTRLAEKERVGPLLHVFCNSEAVGRTFPTAVRDEFARMYYQAAALNAVYWRRLRLITAELSRRGIPVIVLKGSHLARLLYGNRALRPMRDIDVLVRRASLQEALAVITAQGFREGDSVQAEFNRRASHHLVLKGGEDESEEVELHWTLARVKVERQPRLEAWLWEQTTPFKFDDASDQPGDLVFALTPTANTLVVAGHLVHQHSMRHLLWLYDIHLLISKQGDLVDWDEVYARAEEFGLSTALQIALAGVSQYFQTPLPARIRSEAFANRLATIHVLSTAPGVALRTLASIGWRDRLWLMRTSILPTRRQMLKRYTPNPPFLWPLFYPVRWVGFAWKTIRLGPRLFRAWRAFHDG